MTIGIFLFLEESNKTSFLESTAKEGVSADINSAFLLVLQETSNPNNTIIKMPFNISKIVCN